MLSKNAIKMVSISLRNFAVYGRVDILINPKF